MALMILTPGVRITLQDGGRPGRAGEGLPRGGFADAPSARLANLLVGNPIGGPVLEYCLTAPRIRITEDCTLAVTGADFDVRVDGRPLPRWRRVRVPAGAELAGERSANGVYGYLAVGGRMRAQRWQGSVSPLELGGALRPAASLLIAGQVIGVETVSPRHSAYAVPQVYYESAERLSAEVFIWPAPETRAWRSSLDTQFGARAAVESGSWAVLANSNRIGMRLRGVRLPRLAGYDDMRSAPCLPGTVQLAPDGTLLVTGVDGPTMGGYPRIGQLDEAGLASLAQVIPGRGAVRLRWYWGPD